VKATGGLPAWAHAMRPYRRRRQGTSEVMTSQKKKPDRAGVSWEGCVRWGGRADGNPLLRRRVLEGAGAGSLHVSRRLSMHQKTKPIFR